MNEKVTQTIAFFDAEFTAINADDRGIQEMIQCAFIVHELKKNDNEITIGKEPILLYKTHIKPVYTKKLSNYIIELTGISQSDIDNGKELSTVLEELYQLGKKYNVRRILVWGPDAFMIRDNCRAVECDTPHARWIRRKIKDISISMTKLVGESKLLSQHKMCQILQIEEEGNLHDAYSDARNLSHIVIQCCGKLDQMKSTAQPVD